MRTLTDPGFKGEQWFAQELCKSCNWRSKNFLFKRVWKSTWAGLSNLGSLQTLLQQPRWDFFRSIGSDSWQTKVHQFSSPAPSTTSSFTGQNPFSEKPRLSIREVIWTLPSEPLFVNRTTSCNSIYSTRTSTCLLRLSQIHNRPITHLRDSEHYRFPHGQVQWTETKSWTAKSGRCPQVPFCIFSPILWVGGWESTLNFGPRSTKLVGNIRVTKNLPTLTIKAVLTEIMEEQSFSAFCLATAAM